MASLGGRVVVVHTVTNTDKCETTMEHYLYPLETYHAYQREEQGEGWTCWIIPMRDGSIAATGYGIISTAARTSDMSIFQQDTQHHALPQHASPHTFNYIVRTWSTDSDRNMGSRRQEFLASVSDMVLLLLVGVDMW
jgi:hypothetical protein